MPHLLPFIWFVLILAEIALYVILDGANLGIGILSLISQDEGDRSLFLHTLGPTWNANETWLLVAAGSLFGAFPLVFALALNALYVPGVVLLVGIIFRAVSFEFYDYAVRKRIWSFIFGLGSLLVAIGQGCILGGIFSGIAISGGHFAGTPWSWATTFTFFFTVGVLSSYLVLGDAYLIRKTGKEFSKLAFSRILSFIFVGIASFVLAAFELPGPTLTLFLSRWMIAPWDIILPALGIVALIALILLTLQAFGHTSGKHVYALTLVVLAIGFVGVAVGIFPYILPPTIPYWVVASPASTLTFMLWGIGPILPIILVYNWYLAHIFRHKPDAPRRVTMYNEDS